MNVFYSQSTKCYDWLDWTVPKPHKPPTGPQNVLNMLNVLRNRHPVACWPQSERVKQLNVSMFPAFPVEFLHYWCSELIFFDVLCAAASCHGSDKMYTCTEEKNKQKKTTHLMLHLYQIVASPVSKDHFSLRTIVAFPWGLFMHILKNILKFATHFFLRSLEMVCLVRIAADARDVIRKQRCRINCDTASQASLTIPV